MRLTMLVLLLFALLPPAAHADGGFRSSADARKRCAGTASKAASKDDAGYCLGFVEGTDQTYDFSKKFTEFGAPTCIPEHVGTTELLRVWMAFLDRNPGLLKEPAVETYFHAIENRFPCPE